jgi:hypothetical protein
MLIQAFSLLQKVRSWFVHYGKPEPGSKKAKQGKKSGKKEKLSYKFRDVVLETHSDRILDIAGELSNNAACGTKEWLKFYPAAINRVIKKLTEAEYATADELLDEWNALGPPSSIKAT